MQEEKKSIKEILSESKIGFKREVKNKKRWIACCIELLLVMVLIIADLLTKKYIYGACLVKGKIDIIKGVISFVPVENTGASFGMLSNQTLYLTIVSCICSAFLLFFIFYTYKRRNLWLRSALILITAGAIGNIIDRIALGYVRDFIYFELINFAVFNFADSCLTVGTIVLLVYIIFYYGKEEQELQKQKVATKQVSEKETTLVSSEQIISDSDEMNATKEDIPSENDTQRKEDTDPEDGAI